jgi:RNA polymerase sigma factor (sigma-70 family)
MIKRKPIKIGIIETNSMLREYLSNIIDSDPDMTVAFAISKYVPSESYIADVILLNYDLIPFQCDGKRYQSKLIILNFNIETINIVQCIQQGVTGFILKESPSKDIANVIKSVWAGDWVIPSQVSAKLYNQLSNKKKMKDLSNLLAIDRLTNRERQLMPLICEGLTNKEIANQLAISVDTVKAHMHNIIEKLNISGRMEIVRNSGRPSNMEDQPDEM